MTPRLRLALILIVVIVAIMVPEFGIVMSFLGALIAFALCVIGPLAAKMAITERCEKVDLAFLVTAAIMGIWGTIACVVDRIRED